MPLANSVCRLLRGQTLLPWLLLAGGLIPITEPVPVSAAVSPVSATASQFLAALVSQADPAVRDREDQLQLAYPGGTTDEDEVAAFWKTLGVVRTDLASRGEPLPERQTSAGELAWTVDRAAIGFLYQIDATSRYLAVRLAIGNRTKEPLQVDPARISAEIDGVSQPLKPMQEPLLRNGFMYQDLPHPLEMCQPPKEITVPAGGIASAWLVFPGLSGETTVPPTLLKFALPDGEVTIDVRAHQRAILQLTTERLGPQGGLALITIGGPLNTFNAQSLVDEADRLVTQNIVRGVLRWQATSPSPDMQVANWLQLVVSNSGNGQFASEQFPKFPALMRELHLVHPPSGELAAVDPYDQPGTVARFHSSDIDAIAAALRTTYFTEAPAELRRQILQGHPLARAAALIHGSNRLSTSDLPIILPLADDADPIIRMAALRALREFPDAPALDRLETAIRSDQLEERRTAVASLADSRFTAAADRLSTLLETGDSALQDRILAELTARPRPAWADAMQRHAHDSSGRLRVQVLRALVQLDHPRVVELLAEGLRSSDASIRDFVFPILSRRADERSFQLASAYVLERLPEGELNDDMLNFLTRARDRRVLPTLVSRLSRSGDKATIIDVIGQMGDSATGDQLAEIFPSLEAHEQVAAINALHKLRHRRFLEIAQLGLTSPHVTVCLNTINSLVQEGSPAAVESLARALQTSTQVPVLSNLAMGLVSLGTPEARDALIMASKSTHVARKEAGLTGLENLRGNSPARNFVLQAAEFIRTQQWTEASELLRVATELDPFLPEGFGGLGDVELKQEHWNEAATAFERALELSPDDNHATTGKAIAYVMLNRMEEAHQILEAARPKHPKDAIFQYNAACVLGRSLEQLAKQPASAERDARMAEFRKQAFADLKQAIKLGFNQWDWMRQDPDLKSLHGTPEFEQLSQRPKGAEGDAPVP